MYIKALGALCSPKDVRDYKATCTSYFQLPEEYECYVGKVKNQGNVSSCVAHSLAEVVEIFNHTQENDDTAMSTGYIYGNRLHSDHKGDGMIIRDALKAVMEYGTTPYAKFPANVEVPAAITRFNDNLKYLGHEAYPNRISSYYSISSDRTLKSALYNGNCVIFSIPWYNDIKVVDGVIKTAQDKNDIDGYHCMIIYGWNKKGWLIQNSWGTEWGDKGRAILPYDIKRTETWGIKDTLSNLEGRREWCKKANNKITDYISRIETLRYSIDSLELDLDLIRKGQYKGTRTEDAIMKDISNIELEISEIYDKVYRLQDQIIEMNVDNMEIKKPFSSKIGKIIASILNYLFSLIKK